MEEVTGFLPVNASAFGVKEFGEAGVVGYAVEVGVEAGLETVLAVEANGFGEVMDAGVGVAGHAGKEGEAVESVVGGLLLEEDGLKVGAGVFVVAVVEQGDGVVVALFVGLEAGGALVNLRDAGGDVHADAVGEILWCGLEHFGEGVVGLLVFPGLHELERGLIEAESRLACGVERVLRIPCECARWLMGSDRPGHCGRRWFRHRMVGLGSGSRCYRLCRHSVSGVDGPDPEDEVR
jgi:hypothetical protein